MNTANEAPPPIPLSKEEQELKDLLDRVLVASTTQPLRDDLSRALPEVQDSVEAAINGAQKRLTYHITVAQEQTREQVDTALENIRYRLSDALDQVVADVNSRLTQDAGKTREALMHAHAQTEAAAQTGIDTLGHEIELKLNRHQAELALALSTLQDETQRCVAERTSQTEQLTRAIEDVSEYVKSLTHQAAASTKRAALLQWVVLTMVAIQLIGWLYKILV